MANGNGGGVIEATITPADRMPGMEKFNQIVRSFPLIVLTLAVAYGFTVSKVISTESILLIVMAVYNYWYNSDQRKRQSEEVKEAVKAATATPPIVVVPPPPPPDPKPEVKP